MKNKKILYGVIISVAVLLVVGSIIFFSTVCFHKWTEATCTAPVTCSKCGMTEGEPLNEQDFIKSLVTGLEKRWILTKEDEQKTMLTKDDWAGYFEAEYSEIAKYEYADFKDKNLSDLVKRYVNSIIQSKECLPYVNTAQWEAKYSSGVYQDRVELLYQINSIIPIPVSDVNKGELQNLLTDGEVTHLVRELLKNVKFNMVMDDYGWKTYEAIVENKTTIDFSYFAFNVDLIDKDGITLTTAIASVEGWQAGEKSRFTFDTSEEFEMMEIESASWSY